ncbi:glycerophosphodiester phosphodiesterase family protein [Nocardioides jiangxiensis]|uniref:Glycerophosphodiester phosphodiesterase family protein n=1 Tax=Nocardioides jiangxiensis TaxID=3064524 RepID=A0ABT9AWS0_9ACTN|nr:glycerophosphodiester phosphodiesterase family protein [Nocardioides sp. WY-20]MDO7866814.1 glycerophosphodiester phosphodiesterase family protein [Nocardioides sp. WY-20]
MIPFAHRGGALHPELEGLENTLAAFRHAYALGYRHLETDVHVTRDGVLLAFHDERLDRVTDLTGALADLTYAEVRTARVGGREPVPTLADLVDAFPEARFNIDIKSRRAAAPLARFLTDRGVEDRVMVGSFSPAALREFRRLTRGAVPTSAHPLEVAAFLASPSGRVAGRLTMGRPRALQVPVRHGRVRVVTRRFVEKAHAAGLEVHVWTVDDPAEIRRLHELGVDGIFTDRTDLLRDTLTELGLWHSVEDS